MIYIFTQENDFSTNEVIDWLTYYAYPFKRIHHGDEAAVEVLFEHLASLSLAVQAGENLRTLDQRIAFWFRRPSPYLMRQLASRSLDQSSIVFPIFKQDSKLFQSLQTNYKFYLHTYFDLILDDESKRIGSYKKTGLNKLHVLNLAQKHGIAIPPSLVSAEMELIKAFFEKHDQDLISKTLFEVVQPEGVLEEGFLIRGLTQRITSLADFPKSFFPTLFQKNIHKQYELRIFYLKGACYSTAMFTQANEKTAVDFRNYDTAIPTRKVPYQLPEALEHKIDLLMREIGLNQGSIDMIKGTDGQYYFLEINPVGQYSFISQPCNYNLSKRIAEALIQIYHGTFSDQRQSTHSLQLSPQYGLLQ